MDSVLENESPRYGGMGGGVALGSLSSSSGTGGIWCCREREWERGGRRREEGRGRGKRGERERWKEVERGRKEEERKKEERVNVLISSVYMHTHILRQVFTANT